MKLPTLSNRFLLSPAFLNGEILWNYLKLHHTVFDHFDLIFVLGSNDVKVPLRAAELYHQGVAPLILFSGGRGNYTESWPQTEAETFRQIAVAAGVPDENIILEDQSTNTGENVRFSHKVVQNLSIPKVQKVLLLQKPFMERRSMATFLKQWPGAEDLELVDVTSPQGEFEEYLALAPADLDGQTPDDVINGMVGVMDRMFRYPARGFQVPMKIPEEVGKAFERLKRMGYTKEVGSS